MNEGKIILDLCGGTASWAKPYLDAGYTVYTITLPDFDVTKVLLDKHIIFFRQPDGDSISVPVERVHGIFAAPPCTMFSLARAGAKTPRDFVGAMQTVRACLEVIWHCRTHGNLKWWALENPVGLTRQFLGAPAMTFEPWQFGDPSKKRTDLWGYFDEPRKLKGTLLRPEYPRSGPGSWANKSKRTRSITPPGFARAFFKANQ